MHWDLRNNWKTGKSLPLSSTSNFTLKAERKSFITRKRPKVLKAGLPGMFLPAFRGTSGNTPSGLLKNSVQGRHAVFAELLRLSYDGLILIFSAAG
jgi:hypothetical protein